jgi:antitoxin ParD1/3/4
MNVTLPEEMADYIGRKVSSGEYPSPTDVIGDALRLLRERDEEKSKLEELRREIAVGLNEADQGKVAPLNARETLTRVRERRAAGSGEP